MKQRANKCALFSFQLTSKTQCESLKINLVYSLETHSCLFLSSSANVKSANT